MGKDGELYLDAAYLLLSELSIRIDLFVSEARGASVFQGRRVNLSYVVRCCYA